jgi:hypothetical protein
MKRYLLMGVSLVMTLWAPMPALSGAVTLHYGFVPGQQWECTRMTHMEFMVMGKKEINRKKDTLLYVVTKGAKKGWVHLTARYINPPPKSEENQYALGQYDLTFSADVHSSGDTRNIRVEGMEKPMADTTLEPQAKTAMVQTNRMLAQSLQPAVFWFPELTEEALQAGDEFEEKRTQGIKDPNMAYTSKTRKVFVLEEVSHGLAYFSTKERHAGKTSTAMGAAEYGMSGKGESIFDLKAGMWMEFVTRYKISSYGQDMFMTEKLVMQRQGCVK